MNPSLKIQVIGLICGLVYGSALADEQAFRAKQAQNPMADIIKLPVRTQLDFNYGHKDAVNYTTALRPSMISDISKDWNMVNRLDIPFKYQPGRTEGEKDSFGLGDITYESWYGPSNHRKFFWGFGPAFQIPTATDNQIGTKKWSAGLSANATLIAGPIVAGLRANHLWSFAGKDDREDVNRTAIEYYVYANLGSGWWIGTAPVNVVNWEAPADQTWTIPLGGGFGKVVGTRRPVNIKLEAYSYSEIPDDLADWSMMFSFEFLYSESSLFKR